MRCYQHIGLTDEAEHFLDVNAETESVKCPTCGCGTVTRRKILKTEEEALFYDDGPLLQTYLLKDGRECKEAVQCAPWSSGPMGFLCLEIDGEEVFKWTEKEIEDHC